MVTVPGGHDGWLPPGGNWGPTLSRGWWAAEARAMVRGSGRVPPKAAVPAVTVEWVVRWTAEEPVVPPSRSVTPV